MWLIGIIHALRLGVLDYQSLNCTSLYDPTRVLDGCGACPFTRPTLNGNRTCDCVTGIPSTTCTALSTIDTTVNQTLSFDRTFVVSCPSTITTIANQTICECGQFEYFIDRNQTTGQPLTVGECASCPSFSYPSTDLSRCITCPDPMNMVSVFVNGQYSCRCKSIFSPEPEAGTCIPSEDLNAAISKYGATTADIRIKGTEFKPEIFKTHYKYAVTRCDLWGDLKACQLLANMCVMTMYHADHATCKAYNQIVAQSNRTGRLPYPLDGQPQGIPWLYYLPKEQSASVRNRNVSMVVKVGKTAPRLPFMLGVYNATGSFIGFQKLTNQFHLCPSEIEKVQAWNKPGNIFSSSCNVTINAASFENQQTRFYELFLVEDGGSYHPVPVRIKNVVSFGSRPNMELYPSDSSQFNRRFTLVDTFTGTEDGVLKYLRVPTLIKFWFRLTEETGRIRIPVLDIEYTEFAFADLSNSPQVKLIFSTDYLQDYSGMGSAIMIFFSIFASFGVIHGFFKTRTWYLRNKGSNDVIDIFFLMRLTMNICAALPLLLYVFLVGISWYYLIFYKIQGILFIIVPYFPSDVSYFNLAVVATAGLEILHITRSIYKQCTAELFFVDWEQAKALNQESPESTKKVNVSIWRSIFMSNEWAKLQVFRKCDVQFTLIGVLVFSKVFNLRYLGTAKPDLEDLTPGQMSSILLFAADSLCWIIMIGIQRIYGFFFYERYYRNRLNQFVDILSLSNISLLVFDEYCHGYYIHGRSVHSTADTDMEELNNCLQREAADMVPRRGFADTNQQSFEIFVPKPFREFFDKIYRPSEGETTRRMVMMNRLTFTNGRSNPKESAVNTGLVKTYKAMNKFLRSFFESNSKEFPFSVKPKTMTESVIGATPDTSKGAVLLQDTNGIGKCLLLGLETDLLIAYMCLFSYVHTSSDNPIVAAMFIWIIDTIIRFTRMHFGERNIAQKSILDPKFLL